MSILRKYLGKVTLSDLAIPSNIKYGTKISKRDGVKIIEERETKVEAWAGGLFGSVAEGGGGKRRVQLWLKDKKLHWHCTGNPKDHDIFCKHCIAVVLFLRQND
jgi:uncharacterized Zn finger protein